MVKIYKTIKTIHSSTKSIDEIKEIESGCWICMSDPSASEMLDISEKCNIDVDHLRAALDIEEGVRVELEEDYTLILVDIPTTEEKNGKDAYITIPMSIILTNDFIITVCLEETPVLAAFTDGRVRDFYTYKRTRFIFQMLYRNTSMFLQYLRIINKKCTQIEEKINESQKSKEIIELLSLEKSLVYFTTSLRSNQLILQKLIKLERIEQFPEDGELLEDVIIENKQATEMANIYAGILRGTREAFSSVIANTQNTVIKFLTVVTLAISIPTMISGFMGMNVNVPFQAIEVGLYGFWFIIVMSVSITIITLFILAKKKMV